MEAIRDNVARVRERVAAALAGAGRAGERVTVVAVTKTFGPEVVGAVVAAGIEDIGENRIQEFLAKRDAVSVPCRWHMIGHLQRNKAAKAIGAFELVHSVDSVRLAEALDRLGREHGTVTRALLQVNTSRETSKHGFAEAEAPAAAEAIAGLEHVALEGLMTIGPVTVDPVETRRCFRRLAALAERLRRGTGFAMGELSMGMSEDFEIALEEGATIVRLGRVITGERPHPA